MTEIEQECVRRIAEVKSLPLDAVSPETSLDEIGVDSLDRVSLSFDLEEQYGIQIPESSLQQIRTVGDVAAAVEQAIARKDRSLPAKSDAKTDDTAGSV